LQTCKSTKNKSYYRISLQKQSKDGKEYGMKRNLSIFCSVLAALIPMIAGCFHSSAEPEQKMGKIRRVYGFFTPQNEEEVNNLASLGVKGICTSTKPENIALLHKYGIEAYAVSGPMGVHPNVITADEQTLLDHYMGKDLPKSFHLQLRDEFPQLPFPVSEHLCDGRKLSPVPRMWREMAIRPVRQQWASW
jgi:hypothetical protein